MGPPALWIRTFDVMLFVSPFHDAPPSTMKKKPGKKRRRKGHSAHQEAVYACDSCGEEIVVPVDISAGSHQDYVEDCPVCCHPMTLHVEIDPDGEAHLQGEHE
jgi:hypothetical protein